MSAAERMMVSGGGVAENSETDPDIELLGTSPAIREWTDVAARGLIVAVAIVLAWYTWAHWGDLQIDCGRELYVPTEILRGKLIYRDIYYSYGPLAPYLGALLIGIFGPHLVVLYLLGIVVAIGCAILLFEIGTMLEGRVAGVTAALGLLFIGFVPGPFNYVLPYSYAATIGLALSLLVALFTLRHLFDDRSRNNLLMAAFIASAATLCKQEFGAASYLILGFVLVVKASEDRSIRPLIRGIAICLPGVLLWVGIYGWFFWTLTPAFMEDSNWVGLPGTPGEAYAAHLYALSGQQFVPREMLVLAICAATTVLLWLLLAKASPILRNALLAITTAIGVAHRFGRLDSARRIVIGFLVFPFGMFLIGCGFIAYSAYQLLKKIDRRRAAEVAFGIFALVPGSRVYALIVPYRYSVYYAMPLFLVFVITLSRLIKAATPVLPADRQRGLVGYLLAAEVVMVALFSIPQGIKQTARLETSWGEIYFTPADTSAARQILDFIAEQKRHGRTVAVLPEAPMLYAFSGTEAPNRWYTLLPGYLSPAGEDGYVADLNRSAPDYILVTARKTHEYGVDYFGIDYDQKIYQWIESNYRIAGQFGDFHREPGEYKATMPPLSALLYQRRDEAGRNSAGIR